MTQGKKKGRKRSQGRRGPWHTGADVVAGEEAEEKLYGFPVPRIEEINASHKLYNSIKLTIRSFLMDWAVQSSWRSLFFLERCDARLIHPKNRRKMHFLQDFFLFFFSLGMKCIIFYLPTHIYIHNILHYQTCIPSLCVSFSNLLHFLLVYLFISVVVYPNVEVNLSKTSPFLLLLVLNPPIKFLRWKNEPTRKKY